MKPDKWTEKEKELERFKEAKEMKTIKEARWYTCHYCKHQFSQSVSDMKGTNAKGTIESISDQVVCPRCKNGLKTSEGKIEKIKEVGTRRDKGDIK